MKWTPPWITKEPVVQPQPIKGGVVKWDEPVVNQKLLDKWRANELPPDLLQAANVPSYDDWKFKPYEPEPGWGVKKPEYVPRQVAQPQYPSSLPTELLSKFQRPWEHPGEAITGGLEAYQKGVVKPIAAYATLPPTEYEKLSQPSEVVKSYEERKMPWGAKGAAELLFDPLMWVGGGGIKGEKLIQQATKFAESQLAKGIATEDIIRGLSHLKIPEAEATKIIEGLAGKFAKVAEKIPEVAPKVGGIVPPNLPPEVTAKLQPMPSAADPLAAVKEKILLLNERVKSIITKQEALYRAERGGRFGKAEEALTKAETAEEGQRAALHELKGQLPKQPYAPQDVGLTAVDKSLVKDFIRFKEDLKLPKKVNALDAIDRLFGKFDKEGNRLLPQRNQVKLINEILGMKLPTDQRRLNLILDAMNIPRATLASFDVSGGLRQNVFFLFGHPIKSGKAMWAGGIKPFFGEAWNDFAGAVNWSLNKAGGTKKVRLNSWTKEVEASIESNPWYDKMVDAGWPITERSVAGGKILKMEETFASKFAARIPFVKWAEAGYVNLLNKARVDVGSSALDKWVRAGVNVDDDFIRMWGKVVGQLTGRGDWEAIRSALPVFNSFLFSPRLQLARVQLPFTYIQCLKNPAYRPIAKEMTRNIVAFVAGNATLIGLAKVAMDTFGKDKISVDFNPISTDFGRIKMGNTRVDFSGGFIPYIRLMAQLITNRKITGAGKVKSLDEWPYGGRWGQLTSFTEMKFSPILSMIRDTMQGHDAVGNKIEWTPRGIGVEAYKRLTPMVIQDTIDAVNEHGLVEGMAYGTLSFFGATVMTYEPKTGKTKVIGRKPKQEVTPSVPSPSKSTGGWKPPF